MVATGQDHTGAQLVCILRLIRLDSPKHFYDQTLNRDTLYSTAVFDLDAWPVTIALSDAGKRLMSMQVIDEDQYTQPVA